MGPAGREGMNVPHTFSSQRVGSCIHVYTPNAQLQSTATWRIESLPEEHRMCFILSEVQGLKYAEISEVLDVPVGTVKSRMHNATKKLREKLRDVQPRTLNAKDAEDGKS